MASRFLINDLRMLLTRAIEDDDDDLEITNNDLSDENSRLVEALEGVEDLEGGRG